MKRDCSAGSGLVVVAQGPAMIAGLRDRGGVGASEEFHVTIDINLPPCRSRSPHMMARGRRGTMPTRPCRDPCRNAAQDVRVR